MYIMRLAVCLVVVFGVLHIIYPWSVYFGNFYFGWWKTMLSYSILTVMTGVIGAMLVPMIVHKLLPRARNRNVINIGIITFVFLSSIAIFFGPYGFNIPNTRISGIFFSEFKFAIFIIFVAIPFSFVSAGLEFIFGKRYAVIIQTKSYSHR